MGTVQTSEDTDRHAAIRLEHLSPTAVRYLDRLVGEFKASNGGYGEIITKLVAGRVDDISHRTSMRPSDWRKVVLTRIA